MERRRRPHLEQPLRVLQRQLIQDDDPDYRVPDHVVERLIELVFVLEDESGVRAWKGRSLLILKTFRVA